MQRTQTEEDKKAEKESEGKYIPLNHRNIQQ